MDFLLLRVQQQNISIFNYLSLVYVANHKFIAAIKLCLFSQANLVSLDGIVWFLWFTAGIEDNSRECDTNNRNQESFHL